MKFERVFLIGFRTTGKSTVGKILAEKINWSFLDMDFLITQESGMETDVLTKNGTDWLNFREIENEVLKETSQMKDVVISCGGGVGVNDILDIETNKSFGELNRDILLGSQDSLIVQLILPEAVIRERLEKQFKNKKIMPFIDAKKANEYEVLSGEDLIKAQVEDSMNAYKKRIPFYDKLTKIKIETNNLQPEEIANMILNQI